MIKKKLFISLYVGFTLGLCIWGVILIKKNHQAYIRFLFSKNVSSTPTPIIFTDTIEIATVSSVIDGDTIILSDKRRVRYIGIDTPEFQPQSKDVECYAKEAKKKNIELVSKKTIQMKRDISETDTYGRFLRYVWVDSTFVNEYLIKEGYAKQVTFPHDITYAEYFQLLAKEAKEKKKGLWDICQ